MFRFYSWYFSPFSPLIPGDGDDDEDDDGSNLIVDTVIYNKKYIFVLNWPPPFWDRNFLNDLKYKAVFYYVNEIAFGKPLAHLWMGNRPQRSQPSDDKVGSFSPTPDLRARERGWRLGLVTNCQ